MRSINGAGRKHGVSLWRNRVATPERSSSSARKRAYAAGVQSRLNFRRSEGIKEKRSAAHDLAAVDPDVELASHDVDMGARVPIGARVRAVRIAESDVNAGNFFVLQDVADDIVHTNVGADGELTDAVAELVGVTVVPELALQFAVGAAGLAQTAVFHANGERGGRQVAIFLA